MLDDVERKEEEEEQVTMEEEEEEEGEKKENYQHGEAVQSATLHETTGNQMTTTGLCSPVAGNRGSGRVALGWTAAGMKV